MAILFNPKCNSNPSILSVLDMQTCSKLGLYVTVCMVAIVLVVIYIMSLESGEKVNFMYIASIGMISVLFALLLTPLANLMGKRVKESQKIDEDGLVSAGVNPVNAKIASFTDQSIRRIGNTGGATSPRAAGTPQ